jgi:large subunit ribosomal protein L29
MKIAEIRDLATPELEERLEAEVKAYQQKKINHSISPLDNTSTITKSRREIARMKTELRRRELEKTKNKQLNGN